MFLGLDAKEPVTAGGAAELPGLFAGNLLKQPQTIMESESTVDCLACCFSVSNRVIRFPCNILAYDNINYEFLCI